MATDQVRYIDPDEAKALWEQGKATFVDVRSDWEYNLAHIPGAVPAPLNELVRRTRTLPRQQTYIAY